MIKRDITETVYEYDKEGKLLKKTVTETHEEENNTVTTYPSWSTLNGIPDTITLNTSGRAPDSMLSTATAMTGQRTIID